ncbi:MAG: ABC transporter permease subunit, partial [Bacillota bacterium]
MTLAQIWNLIVLMLSVTGTTLKIFALTAVFAVPLGVLVALGRMSKHKFISVPVRIYQFILRGTPLILQLLFIYFGPLFLFKALGLSVSYNRFLACIIAFILNYAAYFGEIF